MAARKPRLLILTPDFPPARGGIQLLSYRLAASMSKLDPVVVAPGDDRAAEFDLSSGVSAHRVPTTRLDHRVGIAQLNAAALSVARRYSPDVVLSAHIVVSPGAAAIKKCFGTPVVQYLHASEVGGRARLASFAVERADATIAVSRYTSDLARRIGADAQTLHRIPPGVDLPERRLERSAERPTIITVSRLAERYKGHDTMVQSLPLVRARVPEVQWIVIGDGPRRPLLERLAEAYGVRPSVRFLGAIGDDERDAWLERSHVFAMPSRTAGNGLIGEGFGIVYLEAGWRGLPVVAGDRGGAADAVVADETGLLVDADDSVAVAGALTRLLLDGDLRRSLGEGGAARARQFAWPIVARRVEAVLLSLLAR